MINTYKFIILLSLLTFGCTTKLNENNRTIQRINTLDMNIYSNEGNKIYSITSPESSYNQKNNIFNLKETTINLFDNKKAKYIINSDRSKLSNNNNLLEMNGNVELRTYLEDNDILYANSFIWNINNSEYLLIGDVRFENKNIILSSKKATLDSNNIIEFYNPVRYIIKSDNNERSYEVRSENAFYNFNTKAVSFSSKNKRVKSKIYF